MNAKTIVLSVSCDSTKVGETVAVAGSGEALRSWGQSFDGPLRLSCEDATGAVTWPKWTLQQPLVVSLGQQIEYKYLIIQDKGNGKPRWETRVVGENRRLYVDEGVLAHDVIDDGMYGDIPSNRMRNNDHFPSVSRAENGSHGIVLAPVEEDKPDRDHDSSNRMQSNDHSPSARGAENTSHGLVLAPVEGGKPDIDDGFDPTVFGRTDKDDSMRSQADVKSAHAGIGNYRKVQRIGKGKQGRCFLVELDDGLLAVLKELKGGRHAFRAETHSLNSLRSTDAIKLGIVPEVFGYDARSRQILMSFFPGFIASNEGFAPVLHKGQSALQHALRCWLDIAQAIKLANDIGIYHCDVNPWNVLVSSETSSILAKGLESPRPRADACMLDWACAHAACDKAQGLPFKRRGDFQPAELLQGRVGSKTDVFGCAATLLWLLSRRTRKGLAGSSVEAVLALFASAGTQDIGEPRNLSVQKKLAEVCIFGLQEEWDHRCHDVGVLRGHVCDILAQLSEQVNY